METLEQLRGRWTNTYKVDNFISERAGVVTISRIFVRKESRGAGLGTRCMEELAAYADATGQVLACTPSTDFGATSVSRLSRFYARFGFRPNKGRRKNFRISETMIRPLSSSACAN